MDCQRLPGQENEGEEEEDEEDEDEEEEEELKEEEEEAKLKRGFFPGSGTVVSPESEARNPLGASAGGA